MAQVAKARNVPSDEIRASVTERVTRRVDDVTAVIETPKGSANKYDYDDGCSAFRLSAVMPEGTTFPL